MAYAFGEQSSMGSAAPGALSGDRCGDFKLRWLRSVHDIDPRDWQRCFSDGNVMRSHALQRATEGAGIEHAAYHYLCIDDSGGVDAIVPCFEFKISLTVVAPAPVQKVVRMVRRLFPGFLYLRAFIAGTPLAICNDLLGIAPTSPEQRGRLLKLIAAALIERAAKLDIGLVVIKEIRPPDLPEIERTLAHELTWAESAATTYLYVGQPGTDRYRDRLRQAYRKTMGQRLRKFEEAGFRWELCHDFTPHVERMHALYRQVLDRSATRFETLTPAFFREASVQLGSDAFCLLCFHGDMLVAFGLFLVDEHGVHPTYLGIDYGQRDAGALYFNAIYKAIEIVESRGQAVVELGQTNYAAKAGIGAVASRLHLGVRHRHPLLNGLIRLFRTTLFPPTLVPRQQHVFKDMEANNAALRDLGVEVADRDA